MIRSAGAARLPDMVPYRSKAAFETRIDAQPSDFRGGIVVVAIDESSGLNTATAEELPEATPSQT